MREWLNRHDWKSCVRPAYRGFESHPLRSKADEILPFFILHFIEISLIFFLPVGEVPEWLNGAVSKTVEVARPPRVRIPPSPQIVSRLHYKFSIESSAILNIMPTEGIK